MWRHRTYTLKKGVCVYGEKRVFFNDTDMYFSSRRRRVGSVGDTGRMFERRRRRYLENRRLGGTCCADSEWSRPSPTPPASAVDDRCGRGEGEAINCAERHSWNVDGNAAALLTRGRYARA